MNESLRDLLGQGADSVDPPHYDVDALAARAERRQSRRRLTAVAASGLAVAVLGGTFALTADRDGATPAPPGPSQRQEGAGVRRPLVYAEGDTVHFGDREIDAGAEVVFVEATDDGVVFATSESYRPIGRSRKATLWFSDGSERERIGVTAVSHVYDFAVATANPGSLVAWLAPQPGSGMNLDDEGLVVVYDSRQRRVVARVPATSGWQGINDFEQIAVNGDRVYWEDWNRAWRYDVSSGIHGVISWPDYHDDLAGNPRMIAFANASDQRPKPPVVAQRLAAFVRDGDRLVPTGSIHNGGTYVEIPTTLLDGRLIELSLPEGYAADTISFVVVQWLDNDHLVLFGYHEHNELPMHTGDFLVCPVPAGTCEVVVPAAEATPYVPPGDVY